MRDLYDLNFLVVKQTGKRSPCATVLAKVSDRLVNILWLTASHRNSGMHSVGQL